MCGIYQLVVGLGVFGGDFDELASFCGFVRILKVQIVPAVSLLKECSVIYLGVGIYMADVTSVNPAIWKLHHDDVHISYG